MLIDLRILEKCGTSKIKSLENYDSSDVSFVLNDLEAVDNNDYYLEGTRLHLNSELEGTRSDVQYILNSEVAQLESILWSCQKDNDYGKAMYSLHKEIISWKRNLKYQECDLLLQTIDVNKYDFRILISLLMATFQIKERLSFRPPFYVKVMEIASTFLPENEVRLVLGSLK